MSKRIIVSVRLLELRIARLESRLDLEVAGRRLAEHRAHELEAQVGKSAWRILWSDALDGFAFKADTTGRAE